MKLRPEEIVPLERPAETDTGIFSRGDSLIREYSRAVRMHIIDERIFGNIPEKRAAQPGDCIPPGVRDLDTGSFREAGDFRGEYSKTFRVALLA